MYKATREFIKARQPFAKFGVVHIPSVKKVGGGELNKCFENALAAIDRVRGITIVSGWIVEAYDSKNEHTALMQHWWNADKSGNHFDTSPGIGNQCEYVIDMDLSIYTKENFDSIKSNVSLNLLYKNGAYSTVDLSTDDLVITPIDALKTEYFYPPVNDCNSA